MRSSLQIKAKESKKLTKFTDFFNLGLFEEKKEENNLQKEKRLKEIYGGDPIYYDTWCANKNKNNEIKDFRESKEYHRFSEQMTEIIKQIKQAYFKRQEKDGAGESLLTQENFKPFDVLATRLLNPNIVTDEKRNHAPSEAESMYSDGKRLLEGLFYQIETLSSFSSIKLVMEKLIKNQQGERKEEEKKESKKREKDVAPISVCAAGTRQNLMEAYWELVGTSKDDRGIGHALITAVKQNAFNFMQKTPPYVYEANEIHGNTILVNYFYKESKLIPSERKKIDDRSAHEPVEHNKIYHAGTNYRAFFTVKEANKFFEETNSTLLILGFFDFLVHKFQKDMKDINTFDSATFFLKNLLKLSGGKKAQDINSLRKSLFGFYSLNRFQGEKKLNETQQGEIIKYSILAVGSYLIKDGSLVIPKLSDLCVLILLHPLIKKTDRFSDDVWSAYKMLVTNLFDKTDVLFLSKPPITLPDIVDFLAKSLILVKETKELDQNNILDKIKKNELNDETIEKIRDALLEQYDHSLKSEEQKQEELKIQEEEDKLLKEEVNLQKTEQSIQQEKFIIEQKEIKLQQREVAISKRLALYQRNQKVTLPISIKEELQKQQAEYKRKKDEYEIRKEKHERKKEDIALTKHTIQKKRSIGSIRIYVDPVIGDFAILDDKKYCSLDQVYKNNQSRQLVKKPEDITKELRSTLFFLMLDGKHINDKIFVQINQDESKEVFHIIPDLFALSWVSYVDAGEARRILFPDYLSRMNEQQQLLFLKKLIMLPRKDISLQSLIIAIDECKKYFKKDMKPTWDGLFDQLNLTPEDYFKLDTDILSRLTFKKNPLATEALYKHLDIKLPQDFLPTAIDILKMLLTKKMDINMPESDFLKDVIWDEDLFLTCYNAGCRHFLGTTLNNIDFNKIESRATVNFSKTTIRKIPSPIVRSLNLKGARLNRKSIQTLLKNLRRDFEDMILDDVDFRDLGLLHNISFKRSSLMNTNFSGMTLCYCDFTDANLKNSDLQNTTLELPAFNQNRPEGSRNIKHVAIFNGADLTGANLAHTKNNLTMKNTKMDAFAIQSYLTNKRKEGRDFNGMHFVGELAELKSIDFGFSQFGRDEIIQFCALGKWEFVNSNLSFVDLSNLDLRGADFSGANLAGTIFSNSKLENTLFTGATIIDVGPEPRSTTKFDKTIYEPLYEQKLAHTLPFLAYQGKTAVDTLINLLEHEYLKKGVAGRIFSLSWNRHYVKEVTAYLLELKPHKERQDITIQGLKLGPVLENSIAQKKGTFYDIFQFCLILDAANKNVPDNKDEVRNGYHPRL